MVVVVVVGEGIMRHYDPPPDPNFLPCDFTDWAAQHQGTKAQAAPLPVDQHRPIELFAFSQPVQFTSSKLNFCQEKQDVTLGAPKAQKCWPRMQYHSFVAQYFGLVGLAPIFGGLFADGRL